MCDLCIVLPFQYMMTPRFIERNDRQTASVGFSGLKATLMQFILSGLYISHSFSVCHLSLTTSIPSTHTMSSFCHCETCEPGNRTSQMGQCSSNARQHGHLTGLQISSGWVRVNSVSKEITDDIVETPRTETLYKWLSLLYRNYTSRAVTAKLELDLDWFQINFRQDVELWL